MMRAKACKLGLLIVGMIFLLVAWRDVSGNTINPRFVQRIQDGKTTKNEIMLMFGEPKDVSRSPQGTTFIYRSYKDAPALTWKGKEREINPQSESQFIIDEDKKVKRKVEKTEGTILHSTLEINFKGDGQTVASHEYKEYNK